MDMKPCTRYSKTPLLSIRSGVHAFLFAATLLVSTPDAKAEASLVIYGDAGNIEDVFRKKIIPAFEAKHDVEITYSGQASSSTLATLLAQKASPQIDVAIVDDGVQLQAAKFDLLQKFDPEVVTALNDIFPVGRLEGDIGAIYSANPSGIVYNAEIFEEKSLTPPTSWKDLWNPEYKGHLILHSTANTIGFYELIMAAKINGGDERNIEPGFEHMKALGANVLTFSKSPDISSFFQQGDAWVGVWNFARTTILANSGFPIKFVFPVEGTPGTMSTVSVVKGARNAAAAQQFANFLLSEEAQKIIALDLGMAPLNTKLKLTEDELAQLPHGSVQLDRILKVDWDYVNTKRSEWIDRWNKEVESQ